MIGMDIPNLYAMLPWQFWLLWGALCVVMFFSGLSDRGGGCSGCLLFLGCAGAVILVILAGIAFLLYGFVSGMHGGAL